MIVDFNRKPPLGIWVRLGHFGTAVAVFCASIARLRDEPDVALYFGGLSIIGIVATVSLHVYWQKDKAQAKKAKDL